MTSVLVSALPVLPPIVKTPLIQTYLIYHFITKNSVSREEEVERREGWVGRREKRREHREKEGQGERKE
jgi:hypothetical protein